MFSTTELVDDGHLSTPVHTGENVALVVQVALLLLVAELDPVVQTDDLSVPSLTDKDVFKA